jgi:hypothetical protein
MIDGDDDGFTLDDADAILAARDIGLAIPTLADGDTVSAAEQRYRKSKSLVALLFSAGEDGSEYFDDPHEAERWRKIMNWPRMPTVEEASAWQGFQIARAERAEWFRLHGEVTG